MTKEVIVETKTGTSLQFVNDEKGRIEITNIQGKYNQFATVQGKNFFDKDKAIIANLYNNSGVLNAGGSSAYSVIFKCLPNTIYSVRKTAGARFQVSSTSVYPAVGVTVNNHVTNNSGSTINNFITGNNDEYLLVYYFLGTTDTITEVDMRASIQIELGSTATAYEPFVPNSPSPDYPSVIHNVGDVPFEAGATGKNRFDGILEQGSFNITTGSQTTATNRVRSVNYTILSAGTYRISFIGAQAWVMCVYDLNNNYLSAKSLTAWQTNFTFTLDSTYKVKFAFKYTNDANILPFDVTNKQVEPGSVSTPYEPYKGNQTPVTGQYGALPDGTRDEFVSDGTTAKKIQRVYNKKYDGTENWVHRNNGDGSTTVSFTLQGQGFLSLLSATNSVCSHFVFTPVSSTTDGVIGYNSVGVIGDIALEIPRSILTGYSDALTSAQKVTLFKNWLASQNTVGTPMQLLAPLATPIESPRDRIFTTSYSGITNVYTTDPLQPTFTADLRLLVHDIDRYLNLITSEHSDKPKFKSLLSAVLKKIDLAHMDIDYDFDLDNSEGIQLDVAGMILGISRYLNFQPTGGTSSVLSDADYRPLLKAKIILNQWPGSMETLSDALLSWNPDVFFSVKDNQDMSVDVVVVGANQLQADLISNGYIVPKPAGVKINYSISASKVFAYDNDTSTLSGYDTGTWL